MPAPSKTDPAKRYIGMLSGTSRDGADIALVSFAGDEPASQPELEHLLCLPYPEPLADALRAVVDTAQRPSPETITTLHHDLGTFFAAGVMQLLKETGLDAGAIAAIGSHGQTVWHEPPESIQLGDPDAIAKDTGIVTVADFRRADLEAGGQGAPLAPLLHRALFRPQKGQRAVLNLGGIANLSLLDAEGGVQGFDTGPASCLLDAWIRRQRGEAYDEGGDWAAHGTVIQPLLMTCLEDAYFSQRPPKSTGVEYFNLRWLQSRVKLDAFDPGDVQATLAELTARSIANALPARIDEVLVCGGGVRNRDLLARLRAHCPGRTFESTAAHGLDPDAVEAVLFAWLARERLAQQAQDTTAITGAARPVLLGTIHEPS